MDRDKSEFLSQYANSTGNYTIEDILYREFQSYVKANIPTEEQPSQMELIEIAETVSEEGF